MNHRLSWAAMRVLEAVPSHVLPRLHKAVLRQHYGLENGPDGCTMGATGIAMRIGEPVGNVKRARWQLRQMTLLRRAGGRGEVGRWYIELPADCLPESRKPTDDDVVACAARLADFIRPLVQPDEPVAHPGEPVPVHGDDGNRFALSEPVVGENSGEQAKTTQPVHPGEPVLPSTGSPRRTGSSTELPDAVAAVGVVQVGDVGKIQPQVGVARATEGPERQAALPGDFREMVLQAAALAKDGKLTRAQLREAAA